ncbi:SDR family NAD(P)-dependent oxidoreductase [Gordonia sp. NPDC003376]
MASDSGPVVKKLGDSAAIVVGGTGRVGLEIARQFAEGGVRRIALVGRHPERGRTAATQLSTEFPTAQVEFASSDVNDPDQAAGTVDELVEKMGGVDILVTSTTGSANPQLLHDIDPVDIPQIVADQLLGPLNMSRAVLPHMRRQQTGAIVNIASDAGKVPTPGETVIGAAMAAIVMFSRAMAMEAKRDGIRVNAITPSLIADSGGYDRVMSAPFSAKLFQKATKLASLGVADPCDIAALAVFLAGPSARRITGQVVSPNGGISA